MNLALILKNLIEGKKEKCPLCNIGHFEPSNGADCRTAHCFVCTHCKKRMNVD